MGGIRIGLVAQVAMQRSSAWWFNREVHDGRGTNLCHGTNKSHLQYGYHGAATSQRTLDHAVKRLQVGGLWPDHARLKIDEPRTA